MLDVRMLEHFATGRVAEADLAQLQAVAALYRGDFLVSYSLHHAPDCEHWIAKMQERLRGTAVYVLTTQAAELGVQPDAATTAGSAHLRRRPRRRCKHRLFPVGTGGITVRCGVPPRRGLPGGGGRRW